MPDGSGARFNGSIAVFYLARGVDEDAYDRCERFKTSYELRPAGVEHQLFIIFKGFRSKDRLRKIQQLFSRVAQEYIYVEDNDFDIGAYRAALQYVKHDYVAFFNTNSEILGDGWLSKLTFNAALSGVGMATCTGSYESLAPVDVRFPRFPNVHARSNAFVLRRKLALELLPQRVPSKLDAWLVESGESSLTRRIFELGLTVLVVGRNGRGYGPQFWPLSETFRLGTQSNLLVHDNVTVVYNKANWDEKQRLVSNTWGKLLDPAMALVLPG